MSDEIDGKSSNTTSSSMNQENRICSPQGRYIRLDERLGSGAYKDVWRAYDTIEGIEVAWNVIKLSRVPTNERKRIKTEVKLLKDLEHPNVIKYHNSWVNREKEEIVFVTEIMSSGSLKEYIKKNPIIRWSAVKTWCQQILTGLKFLHSQQIIHRDIKCDNIFINGSTGDIRIGDLGLSTKIAEGNVLPPGTTADRGEFRQITAAAMTCLGTPEFMAPELYDENYNEKVDIYAFGMACLEMVTGLTPYHDCISAAQIYKKVINSELPPELSLVGLATARHFIEACLQPEIRRPSAADLLSYQFLEPNEQDDFLEVRVRLETVAEHQNSNLTGSEDDEDNSDEEPSSSEMQRSLHGEGRIIDGVTHSGPLRKSRGFSDRSESRSAPKIPSIVLSSDSLDKLPSQHQLARAKSFPIGEDHHGSSHTISTSTNPPLTKIPTPTQVISNGTPTTITSTTITATNSLPTSTDPAATTGIPNTNVAPTTPTVVLDQIGFQNSNSQVCQSDQTSLNGESNNKNEVIVDSSSPTSELPPQQQDNDELMNLNTTPNTKGRRLSGNSSNVHEFRKTLSRVIRVTESRGRSSSFIDVPVSPLVHDLSSDHLSSLPHSESIPYLNLDANSSHDLNSIGENEPPSITTFSGHSRSPSVENYSGVNDMMNEQGVNENDENCVIFRLRVPFETTFKEIEFGFHLFRDHPQTIVDEMNEVDELIFLTPYAKQIVDSLTPIIDVAKTILQEQRRNISNYNLGTVALSTLVLEKLLTSPPGQFNDRIIASWNNTLEEISSHHSDGINYPIPINLAPEITLSPPVSARPGLSEKSDRNEPSSSSSTSTPSSSTVSASFAGLSKSSSRAQLPSHDNEKSSHSTSHSTSLIRDKVPNLSPTKNIPDHESVGGSSGMIHDGHINRDDNTQRTLDENDPEYQALYSKYIEALAKIEKDYNHIKANIASQREKTTENYKREYDKIKNRQNDLSQQLENLEERCKERMNDFSNRKQQLYNEYLNKYPRRQKSSMS